MYASLAEGSSLAFLKLELMALVAFLATMEAEDPPRSLVESLEAGFDATFDTSLDDVACDFVTVPFGSLSPLVTSCFGFFSAGGLSLSSDELLLDLDSSDAVSVFLFL